MDNFTGLIVDGPRARETFTCDRPVLELPERMPVPALHDIAVTPSPRDVMKIARYYWHDLRVDGSTPGHYGIWSQEPELTCTQMMNKVFALAKLNKIVGRPG